LTLTMCTTPICKANAIPSGHQFKSVDACQTPFSINHVKDICRVLIGYAGFPPPVPDFQRNSRLFQALTRHAAHPGVSGASRLPCESSYRSA
jgi:hypothetical protein